MIREIKGLYVPLVTPFTEDGGSVDYDRLRGLIDYLIDEVGADGLIPNGTTGESTSLSPDEQKRLIEETVRHTDRRVPVFPGTGVAGTEKTVTLTRFAESAGADGVLVVSPYYIRPSQEGLFTHFSTVAESTKLPVMLYNIPSRTGVNLAPELILRLAAIDNIIALKDVACDLRQTMAVVEGVSGLEKPFSILSGEDLNTFSSLCLGGSGAVAATGHIVGREIREMIDCVERDDLQGARDIHYSIKRILELLFAAPNPVPTKAALDILGTGFGGSVRLPLLQAPSDLLGELRVELKKIGRKVVK